MQLSESIRTDFGSILVRGYVNNISNKENTLEGERLFDKLLSTIFQIEFGQKKEEVLPSFAERILPVLMKKYKAHEQSYTRIEIMQHLLNGSKEEIQYCYDTLVGFMDDFRALNGMIAPTDTIFYYFVQKIGDALQ